MDVLGFRLVCVMTRVLRGVVGVLADLGPYVRLSFFGCGYFRFRNFWGAGYREGLELGGLSEVFNID